MPVSYTHLDVYKRQVVVVDNGFLILGNELLVEYVDHLKKRSALRPVSYTHLFPRSTSDTSGTRGVSQKPIANS